MATEVERLTHMVSHKENKNKESNVLALVTAVREENKARIAALKKDPRNIWGTGERCDCCYHRSASCFYQEQYNRAIDDVLEILNEKPNA